MCKVLHNWSVGMLLEAVIVFELDWNHLTPQYIYHNQLV